MPTTQPGSCSRRASAVGWAFLDRDGTLNVKPRDGEYVERPEDLRLLPGAAEAVRILNHAGLWTGVVTNQRGVALGRMSMDDVDAVHARLRHLLSLEDAFVDAIYVCPHEVSTCDCRKPRPGMLLQARDETPGMDFAEAAIMGDSLSDIEAGRQLGLRTVLIAADGARGHLAGAAADRVVADTLQGARLLVETTEA
jgi:D-glycero-D-manno-heptose 1,7-bisphosphate phosphatase